MVVLPAPPHRNDEHERVCEEDGPPQPPELAHDGPSNRVDIEALQVEAAAVHATLETAPDPENELQDVEDMLADLDDAGAGAAASSAPATSAGTTDVRAPPFPTGLGEGGLSLSPASSHTKRAGAPAGEQRPPKQTKAEAKKAPRLEAILAEDLWRRIQEWADLEEPRNMGNLFAEQRLATVMEYLNRVLDTKLVKEARETQLRKLWKLEAFTPMARRSVPKRSKVFHYTWVDKAKGGVYKSRFTRDDVKRGYTAEEEQDLKVFVPTPTPEAHSLLEVRALQHGHAMRTFDIVAAFLIGKDRGAQTGEYVYMRAPPEWKPLYDEWVRELPDTLQGRGIPAGREPVRQMYSRPGLPRRA